VIQRHLWLRKEEQYEHIKRPEWVRTAVYETRRGEACCMSPSQNVDYSHIRVV